jgi:predicted nucleic acid-binding protein
MIVECLLDTNILVYAVDSTPANSEKKATALGLIEKADFSLSTQIMQEFYVTVTHKFKKPLSPEEAILFLEQLNAFPVISTDYQIVTEGIRNSITHQISYWDGAVLAAAERLNAHILYSKDLNHGQRYGTTTVINPFS